MIDAPSARPRRKAIFDAVRRLLGRGFRQSEVEALDDAIDAAFGGSINLPCDAAPSGIPRIVRRKRAGERRVGPRGEELIKRFEGCARQRRDGLIEAYPDPGTGGAPWTIGWGATGEDGAGGRIARGTVWTQAQCDARLAADLEIYAREVAQAIGDAPTSEAQFDALVSFHYNTGAIRRATLTRKHIAGDHAGAAAEFARWKYAGGRVMKGLVRRRAAEARLYRSGW
ncbi:lysozyme [Erythrobacter sp.]|uniref:lysozyme n=1 Tax=Erythrobacter sp. TaxID=1042 RepID=UPI002EB05EDE|nr:lysozyme [Erythrobacter sp.]